MTEEEAKTKWCPHVRVVVADEGTGNRWPKSHGAEGDLDFGTDNCCLGSACMQWREVRKSEHSGADNRPDGDGWARRTVQIGWRREIVIGGYCGLAGKP